MGANRELSPVSPIKNLAYIGIIAADVTPGRENGAERKFSAAMRRKISMLGAFLYKNL